MTSLAQPLTFRHGATVANRFVQPPMLTNSGEDGYATADTIAYYQAHAKSGGMIITEYMYVSENGGPAITWKRGREQLAVYDDKFIPQLKKVAAAMKSAGNKAIMQIAHTGREANFRAMQGSRSMHHRPWITHSCHTRSTNYPTSRSKPLSVTSVRQLSGPLMPALMVLKFTVLTTT